MADKIESGLSREETVFVGFGMAADEIFEVRKTHAHISRVGHSRTLGRSCRGLSRNRGGDDTAPSRLAREDGREAIEHAQGGFAYG